MGNATCGRVVTFSFGANPEIERGVLNGSIQATIRLRREAEPGDLARARNLGLDLVIDQVIPGRIGTILDKCYRILGFSSAGAARREWAQIHPHAGVDRMGFLYLFHHSMYPLACPVVTQAPAQELVCHGARL
jgi:hypothetical protein